jgi:hypothetical protein
MNLGDNWTPLTRNVLLSLFALYVLLLLAGASATGEAAVHTLTWRPFGEGFQPWQPLTAFFVGHGAAVTSTCLEWLMVFFLLAPVERTLGRGALGRAMLVSWLAAVALGLAASAAGRPDAAFMGLAPLLAALVSLFGWVHPGANILLFFVLPIRAELIAWGTGVLSFLWLLVAITRPEAASLLSSALSFGAWLGAFAWSRLDGGEIRRLQLAWKRKRIERELRRFEVIEGGRSTTPVRRKDENFH